MAKRASPKKEPAGIGRSAITGVFMSVNVAKAHAKIAILEGGRPQRKRA